VAEPRSGADTAFARDCAQKFATVRAKAASPSLRDSAAALQRLSRFAAPRQTGECLGSGLPFGVRWQSREAAPTPLSLATVRRSSPRFERKRRRRPYGTLPPHSKGYRVSRRPAKLENVSAKACPLECGGRAAKRRRHRFRSRLCAEVRHGSSESGVAVPTGLCRRTPKAIAHGGAFNGCREFLELTNTRRLAELFKGWENCSRNEHLPLS